MITSQDLDRQTDAIKDYIAERVGRVETRLDTLNGSIARHERELAEHSAQLKFPLKVADEKPEDEKPALTRRDLKVLAGFLGCVVVIVNIVISLFK